MAGKETIIVLKELERRRRRKRLTLAIALVLVVLTAVQVLVHQLRFSTPLPSNILIFALVNVNAILLLILILLVFRSLFKVYLERRDNILGSRFRVKLVVAFVGLALLPALLLFAVASNLIITSIESWFNVQVEEPLKLSLEIAQAHYKASQENVLAFARSLAQRIAAADLLAKRQKSWLPNPLRLAQQSAAEDTLAGDREALKALLLEKLKEYNLASIQVFSKGVKELAQVNGKQYPVGVGFSYTRVVGPSLRGKVFSLVQSLPEGDLIWGAAPIPSKGGTVLGAVVVSTFVSDSLLAKAQEVTTGVKEYKQLKLLRSPIKGIYLTLFLMVTLVIIFSAVWVGIHLARGITVPIQQLAEGTRAVAAGNLNFRVQVEAEDEIGILVESFNGMTEDLKKSKAELESANLDLKRSNEELLRRRAYMETVLENITTGVLSLDREGVVNTVNWSALRILDLHPEQVLGHHYLDLFQGDAFMPLRVLLDRAMLEGIGVMDQQVLLHRNGRVATLMVNVSGLGDGDGDSLGTVMVLEEITQLIRAQQAMAWREMARRIAHEIKNPLTPIKLSTQRLRKKFAERAPDYDQVFEECTRTIIQEVDGLKGLVDEFSRYARMPSSDPRPGNIREVVEKVVALYAGLSRRIAISADLDPELPLVNIDSEQMKRALVNLVDNAMAAVGNEGRIVIMARYLPATSRVILEVMDDGCGIPQEDKDRLFLPYFSRKRSGTGLGLAIVYRIIAEHGGSIRAEDNRPRGTRMIIELPILPVEGRESRVEG